MNFYFWGGCEVQDTLLVLQKNFPDDTFTMLDTTTLGSLFSRYGKIAEKTEQWYNNTNASKYPFARKIYKEIVSKDYFDKVSPLEKKQNYLFISFTREAEARCEYYGEHVSLIKNLVYEKSAKELNKLKFPNDIITILNDSKNIKMYNDDFVYRSYFNKQGDWSTKFANLTTDIFEDRISMLYTPPARRWLSKRWGFYDEIPTVGKYTSIFKNKVIGGKYFDTESWYDVNRFHRGIYMGVKHEFRPYKVDMVEIDWKKLVGDEQHRLGKSPFHYTMSSVKHIAEKLTEQIRKVKNEKETRQITA